MTAKSTGKSKKKPAPKTSQSKKKPAQPAQAAAALRRKQEFARTLLDNVADGVVACNAAGILVLFNRVAREWHGIDALALPPEEWGAHYDLYGPDGITPLPTEAIPLVRAFRGETVREAEMSIVAKGQPPRHILAAGGPFLDARHRPLGAVVVMRDITERRRAEEDLKDSNEELQSLTEELLNSNEKLATSREELLVASRYSRTLIEASLDPLVTISAAGTITDVNAATEQITGLSRDRLIGSDFADYFTEPDLARAGYREVLAQGQVIDYPLALRHVSGAIADVLYNATVYRDERGNVQGVFAAARDVTERQRVEAALRESEERYRRITEGLTDYLYTVRIADGRAAETTQSPACASVTGYTAEEYAADPHLWIRMVVPEDRDLVREHVRLTLAGEDAPAIEHRIVRKDGAVRWVSDTAILHKDAAGTLLSYDGVISDITERKRAEGALRASETRFKTMFDEAPLGIALIDSLTGHIYAVNAMFARIAGRTMEEMAQIDWMSITHPDDVQEDLDNMALLNAGKIPGFQMEKRYLHHDGTPVWINMTIAPILVEDRAHPRHLCMIEDITERRRAGEAHVALRDQLHQAQKAESLGRMAGAIAHHYNNLLGVVLLNLELALTALPSDAGARKYLADATRASQRAAEISHQMLAYLGQDRGRREPVDLGDACREVLLLLRSSLPANARLHTAFPAEGAVVRADAAQLKRVLTYLAANAGEALGDGEGDITVSIDVLPAADIQASRFHPADWTPKAGTYACLAVADTGGGMTPETLDKVFDPFFSTKFTGRGLGLPVVKGIVMAHEGACAVESESGRGTTFRVYLPVVPGQPPQSHQAARVESGAGRDQGLVLVVEDEPMLRDLTRTVLRDIGYQVVEAADGAEAVAVFREHHDQILCVLCDLTMPGMDGWATLEALRRLRPNVPVILASGYDEAQVMAGDHAERPQAFLHKPYLSADLQAALAAALHRG